MIVVDLAIDIMRRAVVFESTHEKYPRENKILASRNEENLEENGN